MQTRILRNSTLLAAVILLVGSLALPLGAKDKKQVTRPLKASGVMTVHYTPTSPTTAIFHNDEEGAATFTGRYQNVADGTTSFLTGPLTCSGTLTAANGDTVHWVLDTVTRYIIDGGTGRFENASWSFVPNLVSLSAPVFNPDGTFTIYMVYTIDTEGTF